MMDSVSTSMTTACRAVGCSETGIEKGKKCPKCGWERPSDDAVDKSAFELITEGEGAANGSQVCPNPWSPRLYFPSIREEARFEL